MSQILLKQQLILLAAAAGAEPTAAERRTGGKPPNTHKHQGHRAGGPRENTHAASPRASRSLNARGWALTRALTLIALATASKQAPAIVRANSVRAQLAPGEKGTPPIVNKGGATQRNAHRPTWRWHARRWHVAPEETRT